MAVAVAQRAAGHEGHDPVASPALAREGQGVEQGAPGHGVARPPGGGPVGRDAGGAQVRLEQGHVGLRCGVEDPDAVERHPVGGQGDDVADHGPHLVVGVGDRHDGRRRGRWRQPVGRRVEPDPPAGGPHPGVGDLVAGGADHGGGRGRGQGRGKEAGHRRGDRFGQVPHEVAERGQHLGQAGVPGGGADEGGLVVEAGQALGDDAVQGDGVAGGGPGAAGEALDHGRVDVGQLGVEGGDGGGGGLVVGHRGEGAGVVGQRPAGGGGQHRVGQRATVEQPVGGHKLGQAERREEAHVGHAGPAQRPRAQQAAGGEPGQVGRHDHRDRRQGAPALGRVDGGGQRRAGRAPVGHDVGLGDHGPEGRPGV